MKDFKPGQSSRGPTRLVIFRRAEMFYPLELPISDDLAAHAKANPGTLRIEDIFGKQLWPPAPVPLSTEGYAVVRKGAG